MLTALFDLFVPPRCAVCGRMTEPWERMVCAACGRAFSLQVVEDENGLVRMSLAPMAGDVRAAIHRLKFSGQYWRGESLGAWCATVAHDSLRGYFDAVAPVPLSRRRLLERGYNQANLVARGVSRVAGLPLRQLLVRTRHTQRQSELGREERDQVRGAFACARGEAPLRVLVVDDVTTTGATLQACAEALWAAGAKEVVGFSVCGAVEEEAPMEPSAGG